ncbi:MAG: ABC transporter substrate-binding protein [Deltaproteobacteria bacterium]|nr:ABC transporter substrate-binding protein [Deltaproteobacteria bacterium]
MQRIGRMTLIIIALTTLFSQSLADASEPTDQLKATIDEVVTILRDPSLEGAEMADQRRARLRKKMKERFTFAEMAKRSLGKHWREMNSDEREEFTTIFARLIENSYIGKIEGYTDEKVLYEKEMLRKRTAIVKTKIITKQGTDIPLDYRLINRKGGEWMVYDVVIEGVSLVRNYRTQFSKALRSSSYEDLVEKLKSKIE